MGATAIAFYPHSPVNECNRLISPICSMTAYNLFMQKRYLLLLAAVFLVAKVAPAQTKPCTETQQRKVENEQTDCAVGMHYIGHIVSMGTATMRSQEKDTVSR